jgi:hypothetical protein
MKTSHILTLGIGSIAVATGIYLTSWNTIWDETARSMDTQPKVSNIVHTSQKNMWDILADSTTQADKALQNIPSERDQLIEFVNNNPTLRIRIQSMSWYREFLSGKYSVADIKKNIEDAVLIEETIKSDPSILMRMQNSESWRNYLSGSVPPHNIAYSEIPAMLSIDEFSKQSPALFSRIQRNPMLSTTNGIEPTFSEQRSIIEWILTQEKIIQDNPTLRAKFEQLGYTQSAIYTSDWREGRQNWFFAVNDAIYTLEDPKNFDPIVWKQFQESDTWAQYRAGTIDPREAFKYINDLAVKMYQ